MADWINTPVIVIAVIAVGGLVFRFGYWMSGVNSDRSSLKDSLKETAQETRKLLREIREDIKNIFLRLPPTPVAGDSPLSLTDFGKQIANEFGAAEWAKRLAERLMEDVEGMEPFQIDQFCGRYVQQDLDQSDQAEVGRCAYEFGIDSNSVESVLRVVLREELLRLVNK